MRKFAINPEYEVLTDDLRHLIDDFESIGNVIKDDRNDIRLTERKGFRLVIKSFAGMYLPNRIAYSLFRDSKAKRSFDFSFLLKSKGVQTPAPVAYVDFYSLGLLTRSYFISTYFEHTRLLDALDNNPEENMLLADLAKFTRHLHREGIFHPDYSTGNILVNRDEGSGHYSFAVLDLNRIKFRSVSPQKGLLNFITLGVSREQLEILLTEYARLAGMDPRQAVDFFFNYKRAYTTRRDLRIRSKKIITGRWKKTD